MDIHIDSKIKSRIPDFKIGALFYHHIEIGEAPQMLKGRFRLYQESLYFDLEDKEVGSLSGIAEWRDVFKKTGPDPNRYRPSSEALYRRIKKQQFLEPVNSAVDVNNFFSLKHQVPIGIYDADKLTGPISITIGDENASYAALNGRDVSLSGKLHSADSSGAFGSPFVDSKRSAAGEQTKNALQLVYLRPSMEEDEAKEMLQSLSDMFIQVHGGTSEIEVIR
ncbi:hypothetical protein LRR81_12755 [Metabacillus sp. GX 13764]|uniref:B3/B4 domain-containing protein n=1 Tax=Metabacillus kandeliae TaxID=2900151 RepID=UPI001E3D8BED|nr:phenylalanine--tRNA ligase beta subunit-related protein [Metabacillus kandeliae]MCD7035109.1 hypothetical protein [Metabacillus kandeliae]